MSKKQSEQRARQVAVELLKVRGWNTNPSNKSGQTLEENEYKNVEHLEKIFKGKSKSGKGDGYPDFLLVNSCIGLKPLLILETKASAAQAQEAINDAIHYSNACNKNSHDVLCVGVAGGEKELDVLTITGKPLERYSAIFVPIIVFKTIPTASSSISPSREGAIP